MNMATQVQFRRGTTAEHASFTGAVGEVTVDTTLDTLRVHDGATAAGIRIAKFSDIPEFIAFTVEADDSAGVPIFSDGTGVLRFAGSNSITTSTDSAGTVTIALDDDITVDQIAAKDSSSINITSPIQVTGNINTDTSLTIAGSTTVTSVLDEDNLVSDSNTALATQQSIKAYVDTELAGVASTLSVVADDSATFDMTVGTDVLQFSGGTNITTSTSSSKIVTLSVDDAPTFSGAVTAAGFTIGSAAINESELETIDGVTAGTVAASKAVVVDSDKDIGDFRNVTLSGTLHTTTLDVREIVSTDSTFITVNEGLEVLGNLQVNEIVSSDSTEVTINNLRTQVITANDSTEILVNDAMRVSGLITGTATQAQYADLAERYRADRDYDEGHVMVLGGSEEITESTQENDTRIAGVISERWAYLMNEQEDGPAVALKGKVECKVVGSVHKGDVLVSSSTPGHAVASTEANPLAVIGRSLVEDADTHPRKIFIKI